jgi:DNA-binding response OmpR family regulator
MMDKIKVLLVDDEEEFVKALAERMEMRDVGSEVALDGEQALELVKDEIPDVMVLDLRMPGIDGLEVLEKVKKAYPSVEVIILTGHGSEKDETIARRLGAYDYLNKPVDLDSLMDRIKKAYRKVQQTMAATAFAEEGDFDTADEIARKNGDGGSPSGDGRK